MSRSRKKLPISGITIAKSDKTAKRKAHRARRTAERSYGRTIDLREVSDPWCMPKDGKRYHGTQEVRRK